MMLVHGATADLLVVFTGRADETMSYMHKTHRRVVTDNRVRIATAHGFSAFERIGHKVVGRGFAPKLMHGSDILVITEEVNRSRYNRSGVKGPGTVRCDAVITNCINFPLIVPNADCIPTVLFDPTKNILAVVHCGRNGVLANLTGKTIDKMHFQFGCLLCDIRAYIFPAICPVCYTHPSLTVDVPEYLRQYVHIRPTGEASFDLQGMIVLQLTQAEIEVTNKEFPLGRFDCTCHSEMKPGEKKYFSAFGHNHGMTGHELEGNNALFAEMMALAA
jgi:copper oxidase (laccase) domain-containing protein